MCLCVLLNYVLFMRTVDKTLSVGHRALPGTDNTLGKKKKKLENPLGLESDLFNSPVSLLLFAVILSTKGDDKFSK